MEDEIPCGTKGDRQDGDKCAGQACQFGFECASGLCNSDQLCEEVTYDYYEADRTIDAIAPLGAEGDACAFDSDCQESLVCKGDQEKVCTVKTFDNLANDEVFSTVDVIMLISVVAVVFLIALCYYVTRHKIRVKMAQVREI